ncbi:MAG: DUF1957 domain-containing protein [Sulfuricurvum sp.]|nr:DUF1957 domain-containing protein [Sulfuricurvum sp.]
MKGFWSLILHSHLPFVKHPDYDYFLEEHWLFEAISECYIPLLLNLERLEHEGFDFRLTFSLTPSLCEMLKDEHLMEKYTQHILNRLELCDKEIQRTKNDPNVSKVAFFYKVRFEKIYDYFENVVHRDILQRYRMLLERGKIDIITCAATHGFLPHLATNPKAVEVQIAIGVQSHERTFGQKPQGIWLPECAYFEGLDEVLERHGIKYTILDSHGLVFAAPPPKLGIFAPVYSKNNVAFFGRDNDSSKQVWSSKEGYPGDVNYRDFYRDIGYDLDFEYISPYISPDGTRVFTGLKYHKITGDSNYKEVYDPQVARGKTALHAENFHFNRVQQLSHLETLMERPPLIVSPYDAELFGHWWFEGPDFLYELFKMVEIHKEIKPILPMEYLAQYPKNQVVTPNPSSWGDKGFYEVWLNTQNDWIYRHLHSMADRMEKLAKNNFEITDTTRTRVLNQMLKELLLAQSSDWAFLMTTGTAMEYSVQRTKEHISNFNKLSSQLEEGVKIEFLETLETKNSLFDFIDFRIYA